MGGLCASGWKLGDELLSGTCNGCILKFCSLYGLFSVFWLFQKYLAAVFSYHY